VGPLRGERADRPTYRFLDRLGDRRGDDVFLAHHEIFDGKCVQKTVLIHGLEDALASNEPAFIHRLDHPRIGWPATPYRQTLNWSRLSPRATRSES